MTYDAYVVLMGLEMMHDVLIWRRKLETLPETPRCPGRSRSVFPSPRGRGIHLSTPTIVCATETARLRGMSCSLLLEDTP